MFIENFLQLDRMCLVLMKKLKIQKKLCKIKKMQSKDKFKKNIKLLKKNK